MAGNAAAGAQSQNEAQGGAQNQQGAGGSGDQGANKQGEQGTGGKQGDQAGGGSSTQDQGKTGEQGKGGAESGSGKSGEAGQQGAAAQSGGKKAPETYKLEIPDDAKPFVSKPLLERVEAIARANDWTNEEASAELKEVLELDQQIRTQQIQAFETETKADTDFGGDNLSETQRLANLAIDRVFPEGHRLRERFVTNLKRSGYGSELSIVAFLATIGKSMAEDTPPRGRVKAGAGAGAADTFYDNPTSKKLHEETAAKG